MRDTPSRRAAFVFKPVHVEIDGEKRDAFVIALPPQTSKDGRTTGEIAYVYVGTARLKKS